MVTLECLDAFDHLIWLRTGARAAEAIGCNQSTISRSSSKCQQIFNVKLRRVAAELVLVGDIALLTAQRQLHQAYRWELDLPLRFEAQHWMRDVYESWQLDGWTKGNLNYFEYERPLDLLRHRIIDAWLCGAPDVPEDPELTCLPLFEMPMLLVARHGHPLLQRQQPLHLEDVATYPLLPLPQGAFPVFQAQLASLGLGGDHAQVQPDRCGEGVEGLSFAERCLGIASVLTLPLYGEEYQVLPVDLPIRFGDVLVIRTEFTGHRRTQQLLESLLGHIRAATAAFPAVRILEPGCLAVTRAAEPATPDQGCDADHDMLTINGRP